MTSIVVHYQEIALKGRNRPYFISKLVHNLRKQTADLDVKDVRALMGRIEIVLGPAASYDQVRERVQRVFGIANFAKAGRAPRTPRASWGPGRRIPGARSSREATSPPSKAPTAGPGSRTAARSSGRSGTSSQLGAQARVAAVAAMAWSTSRRSRTGSAR